MLFVNAANVIALSITFLPITGCAIGAGLVFAALLNGMSYAPDSEDTLFNYAILGFGFIETFAFLLFFMVGIIFVM